MTASEAAAFATTRDGTRLAYRLTPGHGDARFVLIHSLAMTGAFWDAVAANLADAGPTLLWDCRGHGASDKPAGPYTVEGFADDLADLMDAVGWDDAVVGGCSMGGCVALAFAAAYPQRVRALGLIDTTAWYGEGAPQAWEERAAKARSEGLKALVGFQATRWFGDRFREGNPGIVQQAVDTFLANDIDAYVETCRMLGAADLRARLAGIKAPTTIVVGEEDYATPVAMAEALHAGIAGSEFEVLKGARHLSPLEAPVSVAEKLRQAAAAAT
jgi:3-oxoadipate enol-lactonase